jgi:hypothetical protein
MGHVSNDFHSHRSAFLLTRGGNEVHRLLDDSPYMGRSPRGARRRQPRQTARRFSQSTTISSNPRLIRQHKLHNPFQLLDPNWVRKHIFFDILCAAPWNRRGNRCNLAVKHSEKEAGKIHGGAGKLTCEEIPLDQHVHVAVSSVSLSNKKTK